MKIFMMLVVMMATTSVFAECAKLGDTCTKEDCKKLNSAYGIVDDKAEGVCANPSSSQSATGCNEANGLQGAKPGTAADKDAAGGTQAVKK